MTVVIISTLTFVLSTMPELAEEIDVVLFDNETETAGDTVERWDQVGLPLSLSLGSWLADDSPKPILVHEFLGIPL